MGGFSAERISKTLIVSLVTFFLLVPIKLQSATAETLPNAPDFPQAKLQIIVDNDYAAFLGDQDNVNQLLYQNNSSWSDQVSNASSIDIIGSDTQTYVYIVAMGGGGTEDYGGRLNDQDVTGISGAQYASASGTYRTITASLTAYSSSQVANGTYNVALSDLQSALGNVSWSSAVATGSGSGVPPNYKTSGVGCTASSGSYVATNRCWGFPSDQAVVFRYPISSISTPVTAGDKQVTLKWSNPTGGGTPSNFIVQYKKTSDPDSAFTTFSTPAYGVNMETVTALTNGINYSFRVASSNGAGSSGYTPVRTATPTGPPYAPTSLSATVDSGTATISFTDPASNGGSTITNYQYSTNNGATWTAFAPADTATPVTISGLVNGTSYNVRLRAISALGNGDSSTAISITPGVIVTFSANGGVGSMGTQFSGLATNLNANTFARTYFSFGGWNTMADGSGTSYADQGLFTFSAATTLYAQWSDTRRTQKISLSGDTLDRGTTITLSATGYSGTGAISYYLLSGDCGLRGAILTANSGSGICEVSASIDADATYQSASTSANFTQRTRTAQTIFFTPLSTVAVSSTGQNVSASATSGLVVSIAVTTPTICSLSGGIVRPLARGICTLRGSQSGNSTYLPATDLSISFSILGLPQTISFTQPSAMSTVSDEQSLEASSNSNLIVTFRTSTPTICLLQAAAIVPIAQGVCTIIASQEGNGTYSPADEVSKNVTITFVAKSPQKISIAPVKAMALSDTPQQLEVTSTTSTPIQVSVSPASICNLDAQRRLVAVGNGQCTIHASQSETRKFVAAEEQVVLTVFRNPILSQRLVGIDWNPSSTNDRTPLGAEQLNARANFPGKFTYSPAAGTLLTGGINELKVTFTPDDQANYLPTTITVKILVSRVVIATPTPSPTPSPSPSSSPASSITLKLSVYFDMSSTKLDQSQQSRIEKFLIGIKEGITNPSIDVFGYAQPTRGTERLDLRLSQDRARVVASFIEEKSNLIVGKAEGRGRTSVNISKSRYVEIVVRGLKKK